MAQFSAKPNNLKGQMEMERQIANKIARLEAEIRDVKSSISWEVACKANIMASLNSALSKTISCKNGMKSMETCLSQVIDSYNRTENAIITNAGGTSGSGTKTVISAGKSHGGKGKKVVGTTQAKWTKNDRLNPYHNGIYKDMMRVVKAGSEAKAVSAQGQKEKKPLLGDGFDFLTSLVGKAGPIGGGTAGIATLVKDAVNGELSGKTLMQALSDGHGVGGAVKSVYGQTDATWKDWVGLSSGSLGKVAHSGLSSLQRAKHGAATVWKSGVRELKKASGVASIALSGVVNAFDNYGEYKAKYESGSVSAGYAIGRGVAETIGETAVDWGKNLLIGGAVAAGFAAAGIAAPAVVVGAATVVIAAGADVVCKWATKKFLGEEKNVTELVSDAILDADEYVRGKVADGAKAIWSGLKNGFSHWCDEW